MKIKNFTDWQNAVKAEYDKLDACCEYLNDAGNDRRKAYYNLYELSTLCVDARDLVEWIDNREGMSHYQSAVLNYHAAETPIAKLRDIAKLEV